MKTFLKIVAGIAALIAMLLIIDHIIEKYKARDNAELSLRKSLGEDDYLDDTLQEELCAAFAE